MGKPMANHAAERTAIKPRGGDLYPAARKSRALKSALRGFALGMALSFGLAAPAWATLSFTASPSSGTANPITAQSNYTSTLTAMTAATTYASQSIAQSADGGTITIPTGLAFNIQATDATVAESNGLLTISLPLGTRINSVPSVTIISAVSTTTTATTTTNTNISSFTTDAVPIRLVGPGAISPAGNKLVFNLAAGIAKKNVITVIQLGSFKVSGATGLSSPGAVMQMTAGVSGFVTNASVLNDTRTIEGTLAVSVSGVQAAIAAGPGDSIAMTATAIGNRFNSVDLATAQGATNGSSVISRVANLGVVNLAASSAVDSTAAGVLYTSANSGTLVINGLFSNYTAAWLSAGATCGSETQPTDAIAGRVTTSAITIPNVFLTAANQAICVQAAGTAPISPTGPVVATFTISSQSQVLKAASTISLAYSGSTFRVPILRSAAIPNQPQNYLRIVNTTTRDATIFALIRSDAGGEFRGQLTSIKALNSTLVPHDTVIAQLGAQAAFPANQSGIATLFTTAAALGQAIPGYSPGNASGVSITSIQIAPSGMISNLE